MPLSDSGLAEYSRSLCQRWSISSMAIVLHDGQSQGFSAYDKTVPDAETTRYTICSNTKLFVAVALGILVDEGKVKWNDKVKDVVPGFNWQNKDTNDKMEVQDLLTHTNGRNSGNYNWPITYDTTHADAVTYTSQQRGHADLHGRFGYDNHTFSIAGHLIHLLSGVTFADFVTSRILEPLKMTCSTFDTSIMLTEHAAKGTLTLDYGKKVFELQPFLHKMSRDCALMAAGAMISSAGDMSRWMSYLQRTLQGTLKSGDPKIIDSDALREIIRPKTTSTLTGVVSGKQGEPLGPEFSAPLYGSACERFYFHGIDIVCHPGCLLGYMNLTMWTPDRNFSFVCLTNSNPSGFKAAMIIGLKAFERHFGIPEINWEARLFDETSLYNGPTILPEASGVSPTIPFNDILGAYDGPGFGTLHIVELGHDAADASLPESVAHVLKQINDGTLISHPVQGHEPVALAIWERNVILGRYFNVFHLSEDLYAFEGMHVATRGQEGDPVQLFSDTSVFNNTCRVISVHRSEGTLAFELDATWKPDQPLRSRSIGDGDITFSKVK